MCNCDEEQKKGNIKSNASLLTIQKYFLMCTFDAKFLENLLFYLSKLYSDTKIYIYTDNLNILIYEIYTK